MSNHHPHPRAARWRPSDRGFIVTPLLILVVLLVIWHARWHRPPPAPAPAPVAGCARIATEAPLCAGACRRDEPSPSSRAELRQLIDGSIAIADEIDSGWLVGKPRLERRGYLRIARQAIDLERLPSSLRSLVGEPYRLFAEDGRACTGPIASFEVEARFAFTLSEKELASGRRALARWILTHEHPFLMARIGATSGDCGGARWALPASLPGPVFHTAHPAPKAWRRAAMAAFRELPEWWKAQRESVQWEFVDRPVPRGWKWDKAPDCLQVPLVEVVTPSARWIWVNRATSCWPGVSVLFEVPDPSVDPAAARFVAHPADGESPLHFTDDTVGGALEFTGEASFDLWFDQVLLHADSDGSSRWQSVATHDDECSC